MTPPIQQTLRNQSWPDSIRKSPLRHLPRLAAAVLCAIILITLLSNQATAANVNVLIVGTTKDKGQQAPSTFGSSKAYDISKVRTELEKILAGAGLGTVQVSLHDFSVGDGNQLLAEFYDIDEAYPPVASEFWKTLRGENGTKWNYVILMDEPHTIENFPGIYTVGVADVGKEVAKGGAETVLFMGWPGSGSASSVNHYKEVVYRTGRSLGYKVVPAGLAWADPTAGNGVHGTTHPTANGAYLAAAAIYSRIWGVEGGNDKSASTSTYNPNKPLADAVHQVVKNNKGKVQYSGAFVHPSNVFTQIGDRRREWKSIVGYSSSTEEVLRDSMMFAGRNAGMDIGDKDVTSAPAGVRHARDNSYGVAASMNSTFEHPGSGQYSYTKDEYLYYELTYDLTYDMVETRNSLTAYPTLRNLPDPLLVARVDKLFPGQPLSEGQHGGRIWKCPIAAYLHCLNSGRCAMIPEPTPLSVEYVGYKVGYETAWQMSTLQGRAPGFKVLPSSWKRYQVDPVTPEIMTVRFMLPPKQNVTVQVTTNQPWATVSPSTLTFTPENYNTPQNVTVSLTPEAANLRGSLFNVAYSTSSTDEVYDKLSDSWEYGVNTLPIPNSQSVTTQVNMDKSITLSCVDPDIVSMTTYRSGKEILKQEMTYTVIDAPQNGSVEITNNVAVYTPNQDFVGSDSFTFRVSDGLAESTVNGVVTISVLAPGQYDLNLIINPGAEFGLEPWFGDWRVINNSGAAVSGEYYFAANESPAPATAELIQDVDISSYAAAINTDLQYFDFSGTGRDGARDDGRLALEFRDANGQVLGTPYVSERLNSSNWKSVRTTLLAPRNATVARVILRGTRLVDTRITSHFDALSLKALRPTNSAPVAVNPPQASVAKGVPTVIPLASTDVDMNPADRLTYEIVSGPNPSKGQITGWQNGLPIYTPNQGFTGTDSFTFRVFDGKAYSNNIATASILVRANQAPTIVVNRPTRDRIYMPATAGMIFDTSVTDDGGPVVPGNVSIQWQQVSGPYTAVFGSPNAAVTTCNWGNMHPGTYQFRMTASDGELQTVRNFEVIVLNGGYGSVDNIAPQTDVGGPYGTATVGVPLTLQGGDLSDDGKPLVPGVTTTQWLQVSGPGTAMFSKASRYETDVIFDVAGTYVLRLTGDDGQVKSYEDLTVTVVGTLPTVDWSVASQTSANETNTMTVTAELSAVSSKAVTVPYKLSGTAKLSTDYIISAGSISIPAGSTTGSVTISILSDTLDEDDETVILTMRTPVNAIKGSPSVHTATITDDDATPSVTFSSANQSSNGEGGTMNVTAQLSAASGRNVTVPFTISGTATEGTDYHITASPIVIPAGAISASATITIISDTTLEPSNETVILTMGVPTNATQGTRKVHTATIKEGSAVAWSAASQASAGESGTIVVTAQLSVASITDVTVPFTFTGTASLGEDYTITASPIVIPAGSTKGSATITILPDAMEEGSETIMLTMGTVTGALKGAPSVHTALITDEDVNVAPVVSAGPDQTIPFGQLPWTPAEIGVTAWFDGSKPSSMDHIDGAVSLWKDLSGNNNNLLQGTATAQPTTGIVTINGLNAVDFDGTSDKMAMTSNPFGSTIEDALVMVVHKVKSTTTTGTLFSLSGINTAANFWQANATNSSGNLLFDTGGNGGSYRVSKSAAFALNEVSMSGFYGSATDNVQQVYKNGALLVGDATGHSVTTTGKPTIGGLNSYQNTSIGEVVILNGVVSTEDRQKLEGYLAHKWGLAASLPTNHPYKAAAPTVPGLVANLDGTVTDENNDPLDTTWTLVSGPAGFTIADPSALDTKVTVKTAGSYIFRLTANDRIAAPVTDDIVITVQNAPPAGYSAWASSFGSAFGDTAMESNPDDDNRNNLLEFAFGTDPTRMDMGPLAIDGTRRGDPAINRASGGTFELYFIRRKNSGLTYTASFSDDLTNFHASSVSLQKVMDLNSDYELVKVPFPSILPNGQAARFGCVRVQAP